VIALLLCRRYFFIMQPGLYIVATPIGNLKDVTLRAIEVLKASDLIICEDTRVSRTLLVEHGINKKLIAYNDYNAKAVRPKIIEFLREGKIVSLISDAGTPLISDPGYKLAKLARENGAYVTTIPGACSPIAALTLSGLPSDSFLFDGFLPNKSGARKNRLKGLRQLESTLIFFDRSSRIGETLKDMLEILGDRQAAIAREITKKFEETLTGSIGELIKLLQGRELLGEMVILVEGHGKSVEGFDISELDAEIARLKKQNLPAKSISEILCEKYGISKKEIYARISKIN